ncbi:DEAD/DEAH box helicase [Salinibaculum rarum]|uniref:DEAD/DEAH box helicase n=1 Tax=Salinibaculum rarum TaxID=3058903 RepID=UPI00265F56D6|nr:DEAD/DEAH box helicase [Salinibaculum sp. KK48]
MTSEFNPIELGKHAQQNYANYLIGNNQRGYQGLLENFAHDEDETTEQAFIRSKGPYLQGVASAAWSDTSWADFANQVEGEFAPNGLEKPLIDAFEAEGFENLQVHQEEAIEWLSDDNHALIAAGTGRGKTESWFIPIMQYILRAKQNRIDGVAPKSIKALLTYPTKALAQDQLKRFIEYLWFVNRKSSLAEDEYITIGVYDGDTPRRGHRKDGKSTHKYLEDSFEYFELPDRIADELAESDSIRENEAPNLHVKKDGQEYYLKARGGYGGEFLRFVHLTRDRIEEEQPDILLTNPDAINYRLFNINDRNAHNLFVDQPKFLVFDEVHTYQGLFGAHASMLVKRLRKLRDSRGVEDPLRLIAASATIGQKEELFQRLFGIRRGDPYKVIEEEVGFDDDTEETDRMPPGTLPEFMRTAQLDAETVEDDLERWREGEDPRTHGWIADLDVDPQYGRGPGAVLELAAKRGSLGYLVHLHQALQQPSDEEYGLPDAPRAADFVEYIHNTYASVGDEETARRVAQNALELFELAGYEVRIHVFNWPVDGYYKCLHCHKIYAKPQSCDCGEEGEHSRYVTKIRLCNKCGEQVYEGWYCPDCGDVRPVTQETEGEYLYADEPECAHENHGTLTRVYWTPDYECTECGREAHPSEALGDCQQCGGALTRTADGIVCKNPDCGATVDRSASDCYHCGGGLELEDDVSYECSDPECSLHGQSQDGLSCADCDSHLVPKLVLPWICANEEHGAKHGPTPPTEGCECNTSTFVLQGYLDTQEADYCHECNADRSDVYYLAGTGCAIHDDDAVERVQKSFNLRVAYLDTSGNVRLETPSKGRHAVPCYHPYRDYDTLMRSPINTGVTMSQFMLRRLADAESASQRQAKLMSFADSYRDMERLANDFDEPERLLFIQQVLLSYMADERRATLKDVLDDTIQQAREYWDVFENKDDIINDVIGYIEWRHTITGQLIQGSYRLFNGDFGREYGRLVNDGLLDVGLKKRPKTDAERHVCQELFEGNRQDQDRLIESLRDDRGLENPTETISNLQDRGIIQVSDQSDRVSFDPETIEVRFVDDNQPMRYLHEVDQFVSDLKAEVTPEKNYEHAIDFTSSYEERADLSSPHFTRTAYWAAGTGARMLLSQVYKGDQQADERRRIEHEFKRNATPNFLSTGPAMEIGIDIGDLNSLLLLGTPPNTNAYLQRIGRAGRSSGKSLVTTISKRNPIDFYYHKRPDELIESEEKPVPLNQHNEHVLKSALTWAIMDYIAAYYAIPWKKADEIEGTKITPPAPNEWDRFKKESPSEQASSEFESFTSIYYRNIQEVTDGKCLAVLKQIATQDEGVRAWLEDLLDYAYCQQCGHMFDADVSGTCDNCESTEELRVARREFRDIIDETIEQFGHRLVTFAKEYKSDIKEELEELEDNKADLREVVEDEDDWGWDEDDGQDDTEEAQRKLERVRSQIRTLEDLLDEYKEATLSDIHQQSNRSAYVPQMRAFGNNVSVTRHVYDSDSGETRATQDSNWDRDESMALRELHPYSYSLKSKRGYVTTRVHEDTEETRALKKRLGEKRLFCEACGFEGRYEGQAGCPECGETDAVRTIEPISLKRVELSDKSRQFEAARANEIYPLSDYHTNPQSTYANVETTVEEFKPSQKLTLQSASGESLVTIEHGGLEIIETVSSYSTSYNGGARDPGDQPLTLCRESHCNSVVVQQKDEDQVCLRDPKHNQSAQQDVMVGRTFQTKGLRLKAIDRRVSPETLHTLVHGFRLALQRIGGIEIRSLDESFNDGDSEAFIFEGTIGGNGVTKLLFDQSDAGLRQLEDALKVMEENISGCDCAAGCPECVYQYGCDERNDERTFNKEDMLAIVDGLTATPDDIEIVADD